MLNTKDTTLDFNFEVEYKRAEYIVKVLSAAGYTASIVGGALRTKALGGTTQDIDIAVLAELKDYDNLCFDLGLLFKTYDWVLQHDRAYTDNDGFLADWRHKSVNLVVYDICTYPSIDVLVSRFDLNINQYLIKNGALKNEYFDGTNVRVNPLRIMELAGNRLPERIERFKSNYPNLNWSNLC